MPTRHKRDSEDIPPPPPPPPPPPLLTPPPLPASPSSPKATSTGLNDSQINTISHDLMHTHLAVIGDYMASCITFAPPDRVPAGDEHHVNCQCKMSKIKIVKTIIF